MITVLSVQVASLWKSKRGKDWSMRETEASAKLNPVGTYKPAPSPLPHPPLSSLYTYL